MNLTDYAISKGGTGKLGCPVLASTASVAKCSAATLYMIARGHKGVSARLALRIAQATSYAVAAGDLLPDVFGAEAAVSRDGDEAVTEWMQQKVGGSEYALEWMQALAGQFGMAVDAVPPPPEGGWSDEIGAIQTKLLEITSRVGRLSGTALDAMSDRCIDSDEAELMVSEVRALRTMAHRLERNVARAARKGTGKARR